VSGLAKIAFLSCQSGRDVGIRVGIGKILHFGPPIRTQCRDWRRDRSISGIPL
jgi:hypothetical protein